MRGETGFAEGEYILRPFVLGVTLTLDMFSSKSTFAGGETYLQINSDTMERRVDEETGETVGVYRIELEIPEDEDSYCFRYTLDQHSNHGTRISMPRANNGYLLNFDVRLLVNIGCAMMKQKRSIRQMALGSSDCKERLFSRCWKGKYYAYQKTCEIRSTKKLVVLCGTNPEPHALS